MSTILVVCEHEGGTFKSTAFELLGKALSLGADSVVGLVIGDANPQDLAASGVTKVLHASGADFDGYHTEPVVRALQAAVETLGPEVVLASASPSAKDAMPRLAARLGVGLASECMDLRNDGGRVAGQRPLYAGKAIADVQVSSTPALFTVRANSFPAVRDQSGSVEVSALTVAVSEQDKRVRVVGREEPASTAVDLTEADRIVSGGRSLKSKENFDQVIRPLAAVLGATPGASRACVDAGYADHSEQVGQTGKIVNPSLYIAAGISGAIQHLAGMRTSKVIVAINTDAGAPIFQHATYGIVGDLFEVCPMLTEELEKAMT